MQPKHQHVINICWTLPLVCMFPEVNVDSSHHKSSSNYVNGALSHDSDDKFLQSFHYNQSC